MVSKMVRAAVIAAVYTGTVIGAGFASGQEIWYFFSRYGPAGTRGLFLSTVLLSLLGAKAMEWGRRIGASSYHDFLYNLAGNGGPVMIPIIFFSPPFARRYAGRFRAVAVEVENGSGGVKTAAWPCCPQQEAGRIKGVNLVVIPLLLAPVSSSTPMDRAYFLPLPRLPLLRALVIAPSYSAHNLIPALPVVNLYR